MLNSRKVSLSSETTDVKIVASIHKAQRYKNAPRKNRLNRHGSASREAYVIGKKPRKEAGAKAFLTTQDPGELYREKYGASTRG